MRDRFDHTGIADQDIKPPEGSDRGGYGGVDLGVAGDVAGDGEGGGADLVCEGGDGITVARQEGDICPGACKGVGRRLSDAAACAGDQSRLACQVHAVSPLIRMPYLVARGFGGVQPELPLTRLAQARKLEANLV